MFGRGFITRPNTFKAFQEKGAAALGEFTLTIPDRIILFYVFYIHPCALSKSMQVSKNRKQTADAVELDSVV